MFTTKKVGGHFETLRPRRFARKLWMPCFSFGADQFVSFECFLLTGMTILGLLFGCLTLQKNRLKNPQIRETQHASSELARRQLALRFASSHLADNAPAPVNIEVKRLSVCFGLASQD